MQNDLIVKSNKLIEARMKFTSNEYKIISYTLGKIKMDDIMFRTFDIPIQDLGMYGTKMYTAVKNQCAISLAKKNIILREKSGIIIYNWFTIIDTKERGIIRLCFSSELKDFLLNNEKNFTSYRLSNILNLKNFYSIRLYELFKQYEKIKKREFKIEDLRFILGLEKNQYRIFRDFRKFIIEKSLKEINEKTDIKINFEEIKLGRNTKRVIFYIESSLSENEISEVKSRMENVLNVHVSYNILEKTIKKHKILKEDIYYYLDNWIAFSYKNKKDPVGFLLSCVINKVPIPKEEIKYNRPEQSYNFDQRKYDDDYFNSLYDNFKT